MRTLLFFLFAYSYLFLMETSYLMPEITPIFAPDHNREHSTNGWKSIEKLYYIFLEFDYSSDYDFVPFPLPWSIVTHRCFTVSHRFSPFLTASYNFFLPEFFGNKNSEKYAKIIQTNRIKQTNSVFDASHGYNCDPLVIIALFPFLS